MKILFLTFIQKINCTAISFNFNKLSQSNRRLNKLHFFTIFTHYSILGLTPNKMKLKLLFSGGSEVLFNDKREHEVDVPADINVQKLLDWILDNLIKDKKRAELLITNGEVRPGVLVLVNDTDYEITGGVSFIFKNRI